MGQGLDTCTVVGVGVVEDGGWSTVPGNEIESVSIKGGTASSGSPPDRVRFDELGPVRRLLELLRSQGTFTIGHVKRSMEAFVALRDDVGAAPGMVKPSGSHVREMFRHDMCESGDSVLPVGDCDLKVEEARHQHIKACPECSQSGKLGADC